MNKDLVESTHHQTFESLKQEEYDSEFWSARKLAKALEYNDFRNFLNVIEKAKEACVNSRHDIVDHFVDVTDMIDIGKGGQRQAPDVRLSRYACYLIVQNGDPAKPVIANGQTYFALQTRRQELADDRGFQQLKSDEKRLFLRNELCTHNKLLVETAQQVGIDTPLDFAIFQNHGYKGLYDGLDAKGIHQRKGLKKNQKILDHMGSTELAANLFRATQTDEKLRRDNVQGKANANQTHFEVGSKVRQTIKELGGTMPEDLPARRKEHWPDIEREQSNTNRLNMKLIFVFLLLAVSGYAEQKVVLITGASSGIGLAASKAFQEKGWKVWAGYRQNVPNELKERENISFCPLDVTDDQLVSSAIETIIQKEGRIDALINSAGYGLIGPEECVTLEEVQALFDVNVFGPLRLIQAVLPTMRKQKSGHILNISSGVGVYSFPGLGLYSASKFALEGLSDSLAATLAHWNIRVSVIEPGFVKNNWGKHCIVGSRPCNDPYYQKLTQGICQMLSKPQGQPCEEVAALLVTIAETPEPHVRYQTNQYMTDWIAEKLIDPTGMTDYKDNLKFIKDRIKE